METLSFLYKVKVSILAVSSGDRGMCARMVQGLNSGPLHMLSQLHPAPVGCFHLLSCCIHDKVKVSQEGSGH